jgi:hypothetical protein
MLTAQIINVQNGIVTVTHNDHSYFYSPERCNQDDNLSLA